MDHIESRSEDFLPYKADTMVWSRAENGKQLWKQ
jgi:hypothetical protein